MKHIIGWCIFAGLLLAIIFPYWPILKAERRNLGMVGLYVGAIMMIVGVAVFLITS